MIGVIRVYFQFIVGEQLALRTTRQLAERYPRSGPPKTLPTAFLYETITTSCRRATTAMPEISEFRFASDFPLEGSGFEPLVPLRWMACEQKAASI